MQLTSGSFDIAIITGVFFKSWQRDSLSNLNWVLAFPHVDKIIRRPAIWKKLGFIRVFSTFTYILLFALDMSACPEGKVSNSLDMTGWVTLWCWRAPSHPRIFWHRGLEQEHCAFCHASRYGRMCPASTLSWALLWSGTWSYLQRRN